MEPGCNYPGTWTWFVRAAQQCYRKWNDEVRVVKNALEYCPQLISGCKCKPKIGDSLFYTVIAENRVLVVRIWNNEFNEFWNQLQLNHYLRYLYLFRNQKDIRWL